MQAVTVSSPLSNLALVYPVAIAPLQNVKERPSLLTFLSISQRATPIILPEMTNVRRLGIRDPAIGLMLGTR